MGKQMGKGLKIRQINKMRIFEAFPIFQKLAMNEKKKKMEKIEKN